jgi:ParB family transcriptional regulator, chromosome partitioning protein
MKSKMEIQEKSVFHQNAVFFIEVDKIKPNPFQPRREFDQNRLNELADSVRMYGILQPLVVTRQEVIREDGGLSAEYELIAGERRLRAAKLAGLREVPALIRCAEDDDRTKLELSIIENLQREDLNSIDRAMAFRQLADQFGFSHAEIGKKMGRSREYVSNTLRLLMLPEEMQSALKAKKISEGHTRPLLMLIDRPEEQGVLFKEIMLRRMTVRDAEKVARRIAYDKVRRKEKMYNPETIEIEEEVSGVLGTRVHIERREKGGRIEIDFFDDESLKNILEVIRANKKREDPFANYPMSKIVEGSDIQIDGNYKADNNQSESGAPSEDQMESQNDFPEEETVSHDIDEGENDDELYSINNFSL